MPPTVPSSQPSPGLRAQVRIGFKLGLIAFLIVLLCVPLLLIGGVLHERLQRRNEAVREITSSWGQTQSIVGPVLNVPYRYRFQTWKEEVVGGRRQEVQVTETAVATAHFLPESLTVNGAMDPQVLHRGIYEAVVYAGELTLSGRFPRPDLSAWEVAADDILWDEATVSIGVTDLRGTRGALHLTFADAEILLTPGTGLDAAPQGVRARVGGLARDKDELTFSLTLDYNGSGGLFVAPLGMETRVQLQAPWPDPKFTGAFLPARRTVTPDGFTAEWEVSFYGRSYPQQWSSRENPGAFTYAAVSPSLFGVELLRVVDSYRAVERSIKYGLLFFVLVFAAFFLFEVRAGARVHPMQYLLVGFALCLFYLAMLSLSEFLPFGLAYLAGAAAATLLIVLYSVKALRSGRRAGVVAAELGATYAFLFVMLTLQDYALLMGTVGLFLALAAVMYATRNIDWYEIER